EPRPVAIARVRGFPVRIVLIGTPTLALPQFVNFLALDLGLLIVMTAMGAYLAATAAREAAMVDREAQARRTAEARLLSAIESVPAGFALYDRDDRLILANDRHNSFFAPAKDWMRPGAPRKELRETAVAKGILLDAETRVAGEEAPPWETEPGSADRDESILRLGDGRWLLRRQRRTHDGDTVAFYSDITSLKRHQEELERLTETQRLFVDALEHIPTGLMLCDSEDRLVFCNSATRRYFPNVAELLVPGTPFETLVRAQVGSQYLPSATADPERWIAERMAQHRAGTTDAVRAYADGRWAQIVERRTRSGCTIGIRTDITEIKQTEEALRQSEEAERTARQTAEEANQTKNVFLANMSHELRTPLNAIIGFSEMIALTVKGPLPEIYRHYGEIVCASGRHLLSIISDMLDIAKLNAGKTELNLEPVDVTATIMEAVSMISEKAENARVHITLALAARCPEIEADELRLRQVLLNLLSNAIKFTPAGGRVEVSTAICTSDLRIAVSDTGIGMAPEDIPRALEPFTQVGNNGGAARAGTGLGLPISKSLIVLHGGRFDIVSAPTRGTTVTISLPLHRKDEPAARAPALDVAV
ncbi:MAG: ATP-binding protein, partial [Stellaceae bacterium]